MSPLDLEELCHFARQLAREAAEVILPLYRGHLEVEIKSNQTPVTAADRQAEQHIRQRIEQVYPSHRVLGEEFGESGDPDSPHLWILDPIDGTVSLTRRVPLFGTLIAYAYQGEPLVGVAHFPALAETAWAARGHGAFWNGEPARASTQHRMDQALVCVTGKHCTEFEAPELVRLGPLLRRAGAVRGWGDCYGHVLVATGRADVMIDPAMSPWDLAALVPILTEADAEVGCLFQRLSPPVLEQHSLISTSVGLLDEVLQLLRPDTATHV